MFGIFWLYWHICFFLLGTMQNIACMVISLDALIMPKGIIYMLFTVIRRHVWAFNLFFFLEEGSCFDFFFFQSYKNHRWIKRNPQSRIAGVCLFLQVRVEQRGAGASLAGRSKPVRVTPGHPRGLRSCGGRLWSQEPSCRTICCCCCCCAVSPANTSPAEARVLL